MNDIDHRRLPESHSQSTLLQKSMEFAMPDHVKSFSTNSFQEAMLGLEYTPCPDRAADLFSRACVEQYRDTDPTRFGYLFTQVFEPGVLREIALLERLPYDSLADLSHRPSAVVTRLAELVDNAMDLPVVGLINLASMLISISRFDPAAGVLGQAASRAIDPREKFETAMLEFVISNRRDDGTGSPQAFLRMRAAIETGSLPLDRVLHACTQAVVWYLKRRELPEDEYAWYLVTGNKLAGTPDRLDPASLSSWYRGLAMVPAAQGQVTETRRFMRYSRETAEETIKRRPRAIELNLIKSYHESALKEHMYVTRDFEKAKESGYALIALDPVWGPSYGELAEAHQKFGKVEQAARLYETAAELGPPYVGHHLWRAARCHEAAGNYERAVAHYLTLSSLASWSEPVLVAGLASARRISHQACGHFRSALERLGPDHGRPDGR